MDVPIVPVTHFRSPVTGSNRSEVAAVLAGTSKRYEALELVASEADAILAALGVDRPTDPTRLVEAPDAATLGTDLAEEPQAARLPARRRYRAVRPGPRLGRGDAVRRGSGPRPRRLAA